MAQTMPDALPGMARNAKASKAPEAVATPVPSYLPMEKMSLELNIENLLSILEEYGVKHKEIVAAQAILETGHFTSRNCTENKNLFGLRHPGDGSYYTFDTGEESVKAYPPSHRLCRRSQLHQQGETNRETHVPRASGRQRQLIVAHRTGVLTIKPYVSAAVRTRLFLARKSAQTPTRQLFQGTQPLRNQILRQLFAHIVEIV